VTAVYAVIKSVQYSWAALLDTGRGDQVQANAEPENSALVHDVVPCVSVVDEADAASANKRM
jgi:hypothetical protein